MTARESRASSAEEDEHRLGDEAVQCAGDVAVGLAGVRLAVGTGMQVDGEEDVGLDDLAVAAEFKGCFEIQSELVA